MTKHSKDFPASGKWDLCPSWESSDVETQASREGTIRHEILASWLETYLENRDFEGPTVHDRLKFDDTLPITQGQINDCRVLFDILKVHPAIVNHGKPGYRVWIEQQVDWGAALKRAEQDLIGTVDLILQTPNRMEIWDHKFGAYPQKPPTGQLRRYALGAGRLIDFTGDGRQIRQLRLTIGQPWNPEGPVLSWDASSIDVLVDWAREQEALVQARRTSFNPSEEACKFCGLKTSCVARSQWAENQMQTVFGTESQPVPLAPEENIPEVLEAKVGEDPTKLPDEDLGRRCDIADMQIAYWKGIKEETETRLNNGRHVPGWKLKAGRNLRSFIAGSETETIGQLKKWLKASEVVKTTLRGVADIEKTIHARCSKNIQKKFAALWETKQGKPQLVPESDPAPAINRSAIQFEEVENRDTEEIASPETQTQKPSWW